MRIPKVAKELAKTRGTRVPGEFRARRLDDAKKYGYLAQCEIANFVLDELRDARRKGNGVICDYVVLIGHSWGADAITQAANLLKSKNVKVDVMICLDRVGGSRPDLKDSLGRKISGFGPFVEADDNVMTVFNVMARPGAIDSFLVSILGKGRKAVEGGLRKQEVRKSAKNHVEVVNSDEAEDVYKEAREFLSKVLPANRDLRSVPEGTFVCSAHDPDYAPHFQVSGG